MPSSSDNDDDVLLMGSPSSTGIAAVAGGTNTTSTDDDDNNNNTLKEQSAAVNTGVAIAGLDSSETSFEWEAGSASVSVETGDSNNVGTTSPKNEQHHQHHQHQETTNTNKKKTKATTSRSSAESSMSPKRLSGGSNHLPPRHVHTSNRASLNSGSLHASSSHSVASSLGGRSSHHPPPSSLQFHHVPLAAGAAGAGLGPPVMGSLHVPSTPVSARSNASKKRLSTKLAERFSKFEGTTTENTLMSPSFSLLEVEDGSDAELSPLHTASSHRQSHSSSSHNQAKVLLSETGRKRTIRSSLVGRVKVFDSPKHQVAKLLLSPHEVRQLVMSTTTNKRLHGIVHQYEHLTKDDQRKRLQDRASAKEHQRLLLLALNKKTRRKQWELAREKFKDNSTSSGNNNSKHNNDKKQSHMLHGLTSPHLVFQEVRAKGFDYDTFTPPNHGTKTEHQRQLILEVVERNFCFAEFRQFGKARTEGAIDALVQAFECVAMPLGHVLWHQGISVNKKGEPTKLNTNKNNANDEETLSTPNAFYIVEQGLVDFHADGVKIHSAMADSWFGEQALLYPTPSAVTVSVAADSNHQGQAGAELLKLDPNTYRGLVHWFSQRATEEKRQALLGVDFLRDLLRQEDDQELLRQLASIMKRVEYEVGQVFDAAEDVTFHMVKSGSLQVENKSKALQLDLKSGDYFGERALLGSLPRKSLVTSRQTVMKATRDGFLFRIDRAAMEAILGPKRLLNLQDFHRLSSKVPLIKQANLSPKARSKAASHFKEIRCSGGDDDKVILKVQPKDNPALYVVREGTINISYDDKNKKNKTVKRGEVFGHDQLEEKEGIDGNSTIRRTGGFQATAADGKEVAIGVLNIQSLGFEASESHHSIKSPIPSDSDRGVNNKATASTLTLRNKVRQVVQGSIGLDDLERLTLLGEGEFGEVWLVAADIFHTGDPNLRQKFALKSQQKVDETRGKDAVEAIRREIQVMKDIDHPQIVDLVQTYEDDSHLYMLMGLIPGGELWDRIYHETPNGDWKTGLSELDAMFYTMVVADTLDHMHKKKYIFRDLKPENIMIDSDGYPVLVDFGFAKYCPDRTYTFCGTPNYVAPEIITHSGHNRCVDHWALGITLYEMITGENPFFFEGMDPTALYDAICREPHFPLSKNDSRSDELIDLIDRLLEKDPSERLGMLAGGMKDVLDHPWFNGIDLIRVRAKKYPAPWKPEAADSSSISEGLLEKMGLDIPLPSLDESMNSFDGSFASIAEMEGESSSHHDSFHSRASSHSPQKKQPPNDGAEKLKKKTTKKTSKDKRNTKKVTKTDFRFVSPTVQTTVDPIRDPRIKPTETQKAQSKSRRSAISEVLAGLGIDSDDEYQLF